MNPQKSICGVTLAIRHCGVALLRRIPLDSQALQLELLQIHHHLCSIFFNSLIRSPLLSSPLIRTQSSECGARMM